MRVTLERDKEGQLWVRLASGKKRAIIRVDQPIAPIAAGLVEEAIEAGRREE